MSTTAGGCAFGSFHADFYFVFFLACHLFRNTLRHVGDSALNGRKYERQGYNNLGHTQHVACYISQVRPTPRQ